MAAPSSGQISMLGLARELVNDDYTDTTAITSPISMYNLINGGNTGGTFRNPQKFNHKASFCDKKIMINDKVNEKKNFKNVSL